MTVDANTKIITHYIDGIQTTEVQYSTQWCGAQGGSLVIGQDQDSVGGRFNAKQAPDVAFGGLRVHDVSLSQTAIAAIAGGGDPGTDLWSECECLLV